MTSLDALPSVPDSALPREIRQGSEADRKSYKAALGFERMLVTQLLETATRGGGLADGPQAPMVKDALADALVNGGGLGLAAQIHADMKARER